MAHCLATIEILAGEERELADLVEQRVAELGVEHERIGNSIVARAGGSGAPIALVGHLDTVPNWEGAVPNAHPRASSAGEPPT